MENSITLIFFLNEAFPKRKVMKKENKVLAGTFKCVVQILISIDCNIKMKDMVHHAAIYKTKHF